MSRALRAAARLVWGSLSGPVLTDDDRALLATGIGGVVLFDRNVRSPDQVARLVEDARTYAAGPLRVSIDQEGGHIARIGEPLTRFPSAMAIGATRDAALAGRIARASATELRTLGIDVVLAPVLDVAGDLRSPVIGARAFGDDPALVARMGAAMVRGYLDGGVLPVPKHFPGHGRTHEDSHLALPVVGGSRHDLETVDLPPFRAAVAAGAPALMTSHVVYTALDAATAGSLSAATTELARSGLGFEGLLVTDALVMDAIAHRRRLDLAAVDAIRAGADVVMAIEGTWPCLEGLERAIRDGRLTPARLADATARAAAFDGAAEGLRGAALTPALRARHARLAAHAGTRALTLVEAGGLLPIAAEARVVVVDVASVRPSPIESPAPAGTLGVALAARFPHAVVIRVDPVTAARMDAACAAVARAERVVLATRDAVLHADARLAVAALVGAAPARTIHVALRSPADLALPGPAARIAACADTPAAVEALADALLAGPAAFRGRLPVTLTLDVSEAAA